MGPLGINRITTAITHTVQDQLERAARSEVVESISHSGAGQTVKKAAATAGALAGQATDTISTEFSKGMARQSDAFNAAKTTLNQTFTEGVWEKPVAMAASAAGVTAMGVAGALGHHDLATVLTAGAANAPMATNTFIFGTPLSRLFNPLLPKKSMPKINTGMVNASCT